MVPEEEFNNLKRKLEQTEPELRDCKRRLKQAERKIEKDQKQLAQLKTLVATGVNFRPKRVNIRLNLPAFAKSIGHSDYSKFAERVEAVGFHWDLHAFRTAKSDSLGLYLRANPPRNYKQPFEFEIDCTFRLLNDFSSKDIRKEIKGHKIDQSSAGSASFYDIKKLIDPKLHFLQGDGSVQVEADFTILNASLDHFLVDLDEEEDEEQSEQSGDVENADNNNDED